MGRFMDIQTNPLQGGITPPGPYPFNGDVRCLKCGELVNKRCWNCRAPRQGVKQ